MRQIAGLTALVALLLPAACSAESEPAPAPAFPPAASVESSASAELADDPPGTLACAALAGAVTDASLMERGVVAGIVEASATADAPVADAAQIGRAHV